MTICSIPASGPTQPIYVPFHRPCLGFEEVEAVREVLASKWLTTGPVTHAFEKEFAEYIGCKHALAVNSCTAALQLALDAIGLQPGDEVLVPTYTFTATAEVVTYFGAIPVLCDSTPGAFNIDPQDVERKITARTKAIILVHIAGEACALDALQSLASRHGLHLIEDAAHALPACFRGNKIGTISEMTTFSFYATKTITTGEGGMLTTDNDDYAERARVMRLHGISGDAWKRYSREGSWFYEVQDAGYKLNMPDLLAAVGRAQLRKCDEFQRKRSVIATQYREKLTSLEELECPPLPAPECRHAWHLFILRIRPELLDISRNVFLDEVARAGIGVSVHFIPLHRHPFYRRNYGYSPGQFPHAENAYSRCLSLPIFPDMTEQEIERVISAVINTVEQHRKRATVAA